MNWREDTRNVYTAKDGTRCQLDTAPGDFVCRHHTIAVNDFIEDPMAVIARFRQYFPKNHHPACDRKGQNDCDCPDRTFGELAGLAYQRAAKNVAPTYTTPPSNGSRRDAIPYRPHSGYYNSIDESHLWLGMPNPKWRQIRYFVWNDEEERMIVKKHDRSIRNKTQLLKLLRREAPHHVYYKPHNSVKCREVGPDPYSKSGRDKYIKKNAKRLARNGRQDQGQGSASRN